MATEPISGILKIGVIGAGRIGRIHATNLMQRTEGVTVEAIADPKIDGAREWVDNLAIPHVYEDYRMILDDDNIAAVYVCSSTDTHARIVEEAAAAGAEALVTCCPWCESNFSKAVQHGSKSIKLYGLLDLVKRAI